LISLAYCNVGKVCDVSKSFARDIVTRLMGLIVLAMGVQFALRGFVSFKATE
jgi:small neutral amino acid transporter SnatA (MarC family)